jgi:lactoylglutathione lyase
MYTTGPVNSFSHFGLVVPDIQAAQSRMDAFGVTILKRVGAAVDQKGEVPLAFGMPGPGPQTAAALAGLADIGFDGYMIIADPDGNVIEVLQQD